MSEKNNSRSGGIGVLGLLGVVFVTLKLTGVITWSWWYVTMPFWGGFAIVLGGIAIMFTAAALINGWNLMKGKLR